MQLFMQKRKRLSLQNLLSAGFILCFLSAGSEIRTSPTAQPQLASPAGDYFSTIIPMAQGVKVYTLRLSEDRSFQLFILELHPTTNWEESRYTGVWKSGPEMEKNLELLVKECTVYTSRHILDRRALVRKFDCDHLVFVLNPYSPDTSPNQRSLTPERKESKILGFPGLDGNLAKTKFLLSPSMYGSDPGVLFAKLPFSSAKTWALVFSDGKRNYAWGIDLKRYKKGETAFLTSELGGWEPVTLSEVVETSVGWEQKKDSLNTGKHRFLALPKKPSR